MASQLSPEEVWDSLTDVERTALQVMVLRIKEASRVKDPVTNAPLYVDEPGKLAVSRCVPKEKQEDVMQMSRVWGEDAYWMAIRTAEIDRQIKQALSEHAIRQVVIIGAGMDTRAWRLQWPDGIKLFEVDTPTMLSFKARVLDGCQAISGRKELGIDLRDSSRLGAMLQDAGFDSGALTFWLMEGFIGYLSKEEGAALLLLVHSLTAPGSVLLMTAPPTVEHRDMMGAKGVKLHHSTYEPSSDTLARAQSCGWTGRLVTSAETEDRYRLPHTGGVQELLLLRKPTS